MEEKRVNFYPGALTINNALRYNASIGGEIMATLAQGLRASGSYEESKRHRRNSLTGAGDSQRLALSSHLSNQKGESIVDYRNIAYIMHWADHTVISN